ncbi:MAG: isochorismatase family protein [Pseudorhodobacter sp.]
MARTALLVIDMQMGMATRLAKRKPRVNPDAQNHVAQLCGLFRQRGMPIFHIHHEEPGSDFDAGSPGFAPLPCAIPEADEWVRRKSGSSGFSGTGLDSALRRAGVDRLVVVGAVAAFCVTTTVRDASDLGFSVILPGDALIGFDIPAHDGGIISSEEVLRVTLSLLGADFAQLVETKDVAALI